MGWEAKWNNCLYGNETTNQPVISGLQEFLKQKGELGQYTGLTWVRDKTGRSHGSALQTRRYRGRDTLSQSRLRGSIGHIYC